MALHILPCLDSEDLAAARRRELDIPRDTAAELGRSAVEIARSGFYFNLSGEKIELREMIAAAVARKRSIAPDAPLFSAEHGSDRCNSLIFTIQRGVKASFRRLEGRF